MLDLELKENLLIVILSDHGFVPKRKKVCLNKWLEQEGYLFRSSPNGKESLRRIKDKLIREIRRPFIKLGVSSFEKWIPPLHGFQKLLIRFDMKRTRAFTPFDGSHTSIFINKEAISSKDACDIKLKYDLLRDELIKKLKELEDPENGKKIIKKVYKREEIYWGESLDYIPDIVVSENDEYCLSCEFNDKPIIYNYTERSSSHDDYGMLAIKGNCINEGQNISGARIIDVTPTILYFAGLPIPKDMDGRILEDIFRKSFLKDNKADINDKGSRLDVDDDDIYGKKESKEIEDQLRTLGYID